MHPLLASLPGALVGRPLVLPDHLLAAYPELAEARWRVGGICPRVGGWALGRATVSGITVGRTVFLAPCAVPTPALLLHELAHVHQFEQDAAFPFRYLWESIRRGYYSNRYELEADAYSADRLSRPTPGV